MDVVREFFSTNQIVVVFGYGLIYFLLGFALSLVSRRPSELTLAQALPLLGTFGILHGVAEWGQVFIPIQATYLSPDSIVVLWAVQGTLLAVAFAFLFQFGLRLLAEGLPARYRYLPLLPWGIFGVWFLMFTLGGPLFRVELAAGWLDAGDVWARYLLALPGALVTCYALSRQAQEFARLEVPRLMSVLRLTVASFAVYAAADGLMVPPADVLLARYVNTRIFFELTGLPIEIPRGLAGLAITVFVIRMLEMFDIEHARRLEEADRVKAVLEERDRIARELHDGIIQSLYAVGLNLEAAAEQLEEDPAESRERISFGIERLNEAIRDIRQYITNLRSPIEDSRTLQEALASIAAEFRRDFGVAVTVEARGESATRVRPEVLNHLRQITRESLTNAVRHGRASRIRIGIDVSPERVEVTVSDDGTGFQMSEAVPRTGHGLRNMRQRAQLMGGELQVTSAPGRGTRVAVAVPRELAMG
ncbi:MAG TPA: ATP-binding protein [Limnochordales bacterium]|nr:ATP-binding protein [Limnochordales bacterium]